jgi:hypothetical protein
MSALYWDSCCDVRLRLNNSDALRKFFLLCIFRIIFLLAYITANGGT